MGLGGFIEVPTADPGYFDSPLRRVDSIYYRTYQAKDGVLAVGCLSDPLRKRMLAALGLEDIRFEPDYDPLSETAREFGKRLTAQAEALFREKSVADWLAILDKAGVPAGPVRFVEELVRDEQVAANGLVTELEHSVLGRVKMVGPSVKMSETPLEARTASPALGAHTDAILAEMGYAPAEIQALRDAGATS